MRSLGAWGVFAAVVLGAAAVPVRAVDSADIDRAIERGVEALRRQQGEDGRWMHDKIGATALAALTLLECGAKEDDKAVLRAAAAVRKECVSLTHNYSISLAILFLDRLGDPDDVPLIESLMVRLLAGQEPSGGWTYDSPAISQEEVRRLQANVNERKELRGRRELPKGDAPKKTAKDLSPEIQQQLVNLERGGGNAAGPGGGFPGGAPAPLMGAGDNSNTQFAALALWVGRRHGLPVEKAVARLDARFRRTQMTNGGWSYTPIQLPPEAMAAMLNSPRGMGVSGPTASMTCAGVLGLAIADGATLEYIKDRKPDAKLPDLSKDTHLAKGLQALGEVVEDPKGLAPKPWEQRRPEQQVGGRTYYFLWSLERVAVALDLKTIGKKDWYGWGAEILVNNQMPDGSWSGDYATGGADTCFALLFLKRANLARDLTGQLKGKVKDPGERVMTVGGIGGGSLAGPRSSKISSGIESGGGKPLAKPLQPGKAPDTEGGRLADALVKAPAERQPELINQMEKEKGSQYTEALASAIPQLDGESRKKARDALAERLTRLKATTLTAYLQDEDAEIRRAAALAVAMKESKDLIPALVPLLRDPEEGVVRAAHAALKSLTGQDFGPEPKATREDRDKAALKWLQWLKSKE